MRKNKKNSTVHKVLSGIGLSLLLIIVAAVFVHFSWNMAMPELFGAAKMSIKNAFGLVILLATVAVVFGQSAVRRHLRLARQAAVKNDNA